MARLEPAVQSGGLLKLYQALWAPYYQAVLNILGPTGIVLPLGDPHHGQPNATAFTTKGGEQIAFTWSEAPSSFDTPLDLTDAESYQGIVPVLHFNGTDEEADTPDVGYWDGGDGSSDNPLSFGVWVNLNASTTENLLLKDSGTGQGSWRMGTGRLLIRDQSAEVQCRRDRDSAPSLGVWHFLVTTYSGVGGGLAADGITMYEDGAVAASTATNSAGYVAMEADAHKVTFATSTPSMQFFNGRTAGGPLGLFFAKKELAADEVRALYDLGRAALGL